MLLVNHRNFPKIKKKKISILGTALTLDSVGLIIRKREILAELKKKKGCCKNEKRKCFTSEFKK